MSAIAVKPITNPMTQRRKSPDGMIRCTGEVGYCNSVEKTHAETMNVPSAAASIKYSRQ